MQSRMSWLCELPAVFSCAAFVPPSVDREVLLTAILSSACNKIYKSFIMKYSYMYTYTSVTFQNCVSFRVCCFQNALLSECSFSDTQTQVGDHSPPMGNAYWVECRWQVVSDLILLKTSTNSFRMHHFQSANL